MQRKSNSKNLPPNRHRYAFPIGGAIALLAIAGLITIIMLSINATNKILDNSQEKEKFQEIILPVLMFDPVPFENANDLDPLFLLQSSLWATLQEKKESYSYDDLGNMVVPATDIDVTCAKLFGNSIKLTHQSFGDYIVSYVYEEDTEVYKVPPDAQVGVYTPKVIDISKKGDVYSLVVGYLPPGNSWAMDLSGKKYNPEPDKYMIYQLKKIDDYYQLVAITDPPDGAVPGVPVTPANPPSSTVQVQPLPPSSSQATSDEESSEPEESELEATPEKQ